MKSMVSKHWSLPEMPYPATAPSAAAKRNEPRRRLYEPAEDSALRSTWQIWLIRLVYKLITHILKQTAYIYNMYLFIY